MRIFELFEDPGDPASPVTTTQKTVPLDMHRRMVKGYKDQEKRTDKFFVRFFLFFFEFLFQNVFRVLDLFF